MKDPIVEGAYYEREDGSVVGPARSYHGRLWQLSGDCYTSVGETTALPRSAGVNLTRRVWTVYTDPAEVVAELRRQQVLHQEVILDLVAEGAAGAFGDAADLVAEKLGVGRG